MFLNVEGPPLLPWKASVLFERNENSWQGVKELGSEGDFFLTEEYRWTEHTGFLLSHRFTQITRARRFLLSHRFTQMNRTHSIPQRPCGRQISQNLTAIFGSNALWTLYAGGVLWARNVRQKPPWTLCALWEKKRPHRVSQLFFFSQRNTDEQNTQHSTETLSQPISQNLTATFSSNALWTLYAGGLLWARNCAQKCSVNSVSSVRDKTPQRERKNSPASYMSLIS